MNSVSFSERRIVCSDHFLQPILMNLEDWILVNVIGKDSEQYLQNQVTADVTQLTKHQHILTAYCNPQGKTLGSICLFRNNEGFSFIERRSVFEEQFKNLKKYTVSLKVKLIHDNDIVLFGIVGLHPDNFLKNIFKELPNLQKSIVSNGANFLLWFQHPIERLLLVVDKIAAQYIIKKASHYKLQFNCSKQWLAMHIEAGIPIIDSPNSGKFIPQSINLQELGGISFKKGCYIGQEIIARVKSRSVCKYILQSLIGMTDQTLEIGEDLELKIDESWKKFGTVLAAVQLDTGHVLIQAVIRNDTELNGVLVVRGSSSILNFKLLPYLFKNLITLK